MFRIIQTQSLVSLKKNFLAGIVVVENGGPSRRFISDYSKINDYEASSSSRVKLVVNIFSKSVNGGVIENLNNSSYAQVVQNSCSTSGSDATPIVLNPNQVSFSGDKAPLNVVLDKGKNDVADKFVKISNVLLLRPNIKSANPESEVFMFDDGVAVRLHRDNGNSNIQRLRNSMNLFSPVWIRLPFLPLSCWDEINITRIASRVGTPMYLDGNMFNWGRREFARVCVHIKLDEKLAQGVWVDEISWRFFQKIQYEKIASFCYKCGKVGHDLQKSSNIEISNRNEPSIPGGKEVNEVIINQDSGANTVNRAGISKTFSVINAVKESEEYGPWIHGGSVNEASEVVPVISDDKVTNTKNLDANPEGAVTSVTKARSIDVPQVDNNVIIAEADCEIAENEEKSGASNNTDRSDDAIIASENIKEVGIISANIQSACDNSVGNMVAVDVKAKEMAVTKPGIVRLYLAAVYQNWKARNCVTHGIYSPSSVSIASQVLSEFVHPFVIPISNNWETNRQSMLSKFWFPPPLNWIKLNVDASLLNSNEDSIAVVLRDHKGRFLLAYGRKFMYWDVSLMELIAVFNFKEIIKEWMIEKQGIIIEWDNINVVKLLQKSVMKNNWRNNVHGLDFSFLDVFKNVNFHFVSRESNKVADACAHYALKGDFYWAYFLSLPGNNITGQIPEQLGNLSSLTSLNLENNRLSGNIPASLGKLSKLQILILSNNNLTGDIPDPLSNLSNLNDIRLEANHLSGQVPARLFQVVRYNFTGNNLNCGGSFSLPCASNITDTGGSHSSNVGVILGSIGGAVGLIIAVVFFLLCKGKKKGHQPEVFVDVAGEDDRRIAFGQLKRFAWRELQLATDSFNENNVLGQGGFGKVYKGVLHDNTKIAVKRLIDYESPGGEAAFLREVELISVAVHRNLLRLIGFCTTPTERLLVYPFMQNLSVAYCLREFLVAVQENTAEFLAENNPGLPVLPSRCQGQSNFLSGSFQEPNSLLPYCPQPASLLSSRPKSVLVTVRRRSGVAQLPEGTSSAVYSKPSSFLLLSRRPEDLQAPTRRFPSPEKLLSTLSSTKKATTGDLIFTNYLGKLSSKSSHLLVTLNCGCRAYSPSTHQSDSATSSPHHTAVTHFSTSFVETNRGHYCGRDHPSLSNIRVAAPPYRSSPSLDGRPSIWSSFGSVSYDSPLVPTPSHLSQPLASPDLDPASEILVEKCIRKKRFPEPETECIHFVDANDITDNEDFFEDET
ncbi:hypothetical protein M5K25_017912 [Dendrobium thyrsiflorum]|uniref:Protein kinase domain-containing protein n=1 Tax=Dendrobium thyrsiflorum TaxID=117978 RepID=A0ABD0UGQ6_DENTH